MRHSRSDYNGIQDANGKIPEDEPVFVLRGQDRYAPEVIRYWADLVDGSNTLSEDEEHGFEPPRDVAMANQAREWANELERWPIKKAPDAAPQVLV